MLLLCTWQKLICPSMLHINLICQKLHVNIRHIYVSIYASYEHMAVVYIYFTLLAYAPEQICMPHCTCVPLHCYCSLHIDPTLLHIQLHIQVKQNNQQLLFTMLLPHVSQQICPSNATYMQHMPISSCVDIRQLCQYINLIWTHCNQHCHHNHWYTYILHY